MHSTCANSHTTLDVVKLAPELSLPVLRAPSRPEPRGISPLRVVAGGLACQTTRCDSIRTAIDIALPDADVRDEKHLDSTITSVPHVVSDTFPTVAGHIVCGGPSAPVVVGSRVHINNDPEVELVVMSFTDTHRRHVELFPQRGHPVQRPWSALRRV